MSRTENTEKQSVLFFPDAKFTCRWWLKGQRSDNERGCRNTAEECDYAHEITNLQVIVDHLNAAKTTIEVCVFTISCNELSDALVAAQERGVRVRIISDNDQAHNKGSDIATMAAKLPVKCDAAASHMHHKYALIDDAILLNGSFNWTRSAVLYNQENVVITSDDFVVQAFHSHFDKLWSKYQLFK